MKVYEVVTNRIIERLEQGNIAPWKKLWSGTGSVAPVNLISKKQYKGMNRILLSCTGYPTNHFMTFNQARAMGATVRKGEHGYPVIFWKKVEDEAKDKDFFLLRYYTVFNIAQIDGIPEDKLPKVVEPKEFNGIAKADEVLKASCIPTVRFGGDRAYYSPVEDLIQLPLKTDFVTAEAYYETAFHEAVHSTGHDARLKRDIRNVFGDHSYSFEELVAEIGASFLMAECQIENKEIQENQVAYLKNWLGKLKDDPKMIIKASGKAQKAVDFILGNKEDESTAE